MMEGEDESFRKVDLRKSKVSMKGISGKELFVSIRDFGSQHSATAAVEARRIFLLRKIQQNGN
jgi:hypothetical protein